jgi:hypothetical protein
MMVREILEAIASSSADHVHLDKHYPRTVLARVEVGYSIY